MGRMVFGIVALGGLVATAAGRPAVAPPPTIRLLERSAQARPVRDGCTYVGGGTFDVQRPGPNTVVVTMIGAVVATAHPRGSSAILDQDLDQSFEITSLPPGRMVGISIETQLTGVLRGGRTADAECDAWAAVIQDEKTVLVCGGPVQGVSGGENLAINDRDAVDPCAIPPGQYHLLVHLRIAARHPASLRGKSASAEFAPEPALDPIWVGGPRDPFHGIAKKDFGYRVTMRVSADSGR